MEYDVVLKHRAGKKMVVADALSRRADWSKGVDEDNEDVTALPEELFIKTLDMELQDAVALAQKTDEAALEALRRLADPSDPPGKWSIEEGPNETSCLFYDNRLYIPNDLDLRRRIVADHHDSLVAGHPGALAKSRSVALSYWWPGLHSFVGNYVAGCAVCQQFKISTHPIKPSLFPIASSSHCLFGQVGIDFMTDLPMTEEGYDSIMVMVDHGLSKGIVLTPCSKFGLTAEKTAQLYIDNVYSRFGLAEKMISDRGPQFDSAFFKELCTGLGIKHSMTTAFHPQANGGTECVNREVQLYLSVFCINNPTSWSNALKKAEFVYNNRTHADRTQTPFQLMYGLEPRTMPMPFNYREKPNTSERLRQLDQWRKDAEIAHEYARQQMRDRIKATYEPFVKGQQVWLNGRNLSLSYNKMITTKREGPFEVLEVLSPVNYRLRLPIKWKLYDTFHASLLTPYKENDVHGPNYTRPPPDLIDGEEEWEIEHIIRHSGTKNHRYQVKWKGFQEYTWEPEENLEHAPEILTDYWKRQKCPKARNPEDDSPSTSSAPHMAPQARNRTKAKKT